MFNIDVSVILRTLVEGIFWFMVLLVALRITIKWGVESFLSAVNDFRLKQSKRGG